MPRKMRPFLKKLEKKEQQLIKYLLRLPEFEWAEEKKRLPYKERPTMKDRG